MTKPIKLSPTHIVEDRFRKIVERLVNVDVRLSGCLQESNLMVDGDSLAALFWHHPSVGHVAFVAQQHFYNLAWCMLKTTKWNIR